MSVLAPDSPVVEPGCVQMHEGGRRSPVGQRGKLRLIVRSQLDNRTTAAKLFERIVTEISADLGGTENLSQIERSLVEAYAGASLMLNHMSAKLIDGQEISLQRYSTACGALVRIATRLGVKRRVPHSETPSLSGYLSERQEPEDAS